MLVIVGLILTHKQAPPAKPVPSHKAPRRPKSVYSVYGVPSFPL